MKKRSRKSVTQEYIFESEDGKTFNFEGHALEHDIEIIEKDLEKLKRGDVNVPELNLTGSIYNIRTAEDLNLINRYCEFKNIFLKEMDIPVNIIVTDNFVLSTEELKSLAEEINNL